MSISKQIAIHIEECVLGHHLDHLLELEHQGAPMKCGSRDNELNIIVFVLVHHGKCDHGDDELTVLVIVLVHMEGATFKALS